MQDVNNVIQGSESAFRADEYAQRIQRTRERLSRAGVDVMIVTGPENIFWLTGQQTPGYYTFQALLLPVEGDPVFVIRQLEYFNFIANTFISDAAIYQDGDNPVDFLVGMLQQRGGSTNALGWTNAAGSCRLPSMKPCRRSSAPSPIPRASSNRCAR